MHHRDLMMIHNDERRRLLHEEAAHARLAQQSGAAQPSIRARIARRLRSAADWVDGSRPVTDPISQPG